jgi:signal transduction histidine kinase
MERRATERSFWVLAVRDVTERKRAEAAQAEAKAAAEAANRAKTEFLATMSHELRTPLNAVLGFSEMIRDEMLGPVGHAQYRAYAGDIHRSGAHLLDIINDILDTAKIEAGKLTLAEEIVSVPGVVSAAVRLATGRPEGRQVPVRVALPDALPGLSADLRLLKQILLNLLSNALKFTPAGEVVVSAGLAGDGWLEIVVRDTGIGIAQEEIPKVLQPFYQVDNSNARRYQGTGLGLSLVRSLMELHGGELRIESSLGAGTAVACRFPPERVRSDVIPLPAPPARLRA